MADQKNTFAFTDRTKDFEEKDRKDNIVMNILAYCSLLVLIPIFAAKDSRVARFHANQGLVLAIIEVGCVILGVALGWIPVVKWIVNIVTWILEVGCVVLSVFGIVAAARKQAKELPVVGQFKILK